MKSQPSAQTPAESSFRGDGCSPPKYQIILTAFEPTGDFNGDGAIEAADYILWRKYDGSPQGYDNWRANFGVIAGSGSGTSANAAVPEPANLVLLVFAAVGLFYGETAPHSESRRSTYDNSQVSTVF